MMLDDAELAKLLGAQQAQADQLHAAIDDMASVLSTLRTSLIVRGFSTDSAERMTQDYFNFLLDRIVED